MQTKRTRHTVYNITYHLVWCPKYRRPILTGAVAQRLDELVGQRAKALQGDVVALEIQPDHVHLFAGFPPTLAVCQIMHHLKGYTSHELRQEFDWLNRRRRSLWTRSYTVGTAGNVSAETIRRYIEAQAGKKMLLSYKFRLYPNIKQDQALDRVLQIHRQLYNAALQERREAWQKCRIGLTYRDQAKQLKELRTFEEDAAWLNYSSIQQTLRRLDKAFQAFFRRVKAGEKAGYPRFKGKGWFKSVCYVYGDGVRLKADRLYVQHVGLLRIFQHRAIPDDAQIKMVVLKRDKLGNWYVCLQLELPDPEPDDLMGPEVGLEMGLLSFATLSTGEHINNPRWLRASEAKLAVLQRRRARCQRGSRQYRELTRQIRRLHQHIAKQRRDFHHKVSTELVRRFGLIAVEALNLNGLCRSHVSKSMGDAGWGYFLAMLSYKAENAGKTVVKVDPHHTSQRCSGCGCLVQKPLSERLHVCPDCGLVLDRDHNAALNILGRGQRLTVKCSEASASVGRSSPL